MKVSWNHEDQFEVSFDPSKDQRNTQVGWVYVAVDVSRSKGTMTIAPCWLTKESLNDPPPAPG